MIEEEKQKEIELKLIGAWYHEKTDYIWNFYPEADNKKILLVIDNQKPVAGGWQVSYWITYVAENAFLNLASNNGISQHRIIFVMDKSIQVYNPPVYNVGNVQNDPITLYKV